MRVSVVVLGDVGRSPRMLNHACSLASKGVEVDLIGYSGSVPHRILREPRIRRHVLPTPPDLPAGGFRFAVAGAWRVAAQSRRLMQTLFAVPRPDAILVQTPPALPTLLVAWTAARMRGARLVIDWHNLTHSVLALRLGARHPIVHLVQMYERLAGARADANFSVSRALAAALTERWGIGGARVVRDRPAELAAPVAGAARDALVRPLFAESAPFSIDRYALVVVPTSWSLDDDFDVLLAALDRCEALMAEHDAAHPAQPCPAVLVLLTGLGPLRSRCQPLFEQRRERRVRARAVWLPADDYPRILACADLGVSIHRSASGLDLPMKICDLFGAGVPVCALDYGPCLTELVRDGENGVLFSTSEALARQIFDLTRDLPRRSARLERLRDGAAATALPGWDDEWTQQAWPVLRDAQPPMP